MEVLQIPGKCKYYNLLIIRSGNGGRGGNGGNGAKGGRGNINFLFSDVKVKTVPLEFHCHSIVI